jgi:hypothetical protein
MVPDDDVTNEDEPDDVEDVEDDSGGQTGGQTGGQSGGQTGGQSGGQTGGQSGGQSDGQTGGQTGGRTGGQTGGQSGGQSGGQRVDENGGQAQPGQPGGQAQPGRPRDTGPSAVDQVMDTVQGFGGVIYVGYTTAVLFALAFWIGLYNIMGIHLSPRRAWIGGPTVTYDAIILPILILFGVMFVELVDEGLVASIAMSAVAAALGAIAFGLPVTILSNVFPGGPGFADIIVGLVLLAVFAVFGAVTTAVIGNGFNMAMPDDQGYEPHGR